MRKLIIGAILVVVAGFMVFLSTGLENDASHLPSVLEGKPLPKFSGNEVDAPDKFSRILTDEDIKGPALLNIWATWCETCEAEHETLNALGKEGVPIYGLNYRDDVAKAHIWLETLGNPYIFTVADPKGSIGIELGVYGAPETYFLDEENRVVHRHVGEITPENWEGGLKQIFEERTKQGARK